MGRERAHGEPCQIFVSRIHFTVKRELWAAYIIETACDGGSHPVTPGNIQTLLALVLTGSVHIIEWVSSQRTGSYLTHEKFTAHLIAVSILISIDLVSCGPSVARWNGEAACIIASPLVVGDVYPGRTRWALCYGLRFCDCLSLVIITVRLAGSALLAAVAAAAAATAVAAASTTDASAAAAVAPGGSQLPRLPATAGLAITVFSMGL